MRPRHSRIHPKEDDDYRIHYTITSPAFRRLYFSAVEMNNTCKAAKIFGANESYSVSRVVERELSVLNEGKEKWAFETDVFSNGYEQIGANAHVEILLVDL